MYAFQIRGDGAEPALDRVLAGLDGHVAVVRTGRPDGGTPRARPTADGDDRTTTAPDTEFVLGDGWQATGGDLSVNSALDRLAPDHDYAVVVGGTDVDVPTVAVDENGSAGSDAMFEVSDPGGLDVDALLAAVHGTEPHETLESLVATVKRSPRADYAGAIATFTGRVRAKEDESDDRTRYLEFEKYEGVADDRMRSIERELSERDGVQDVRLHHRTGRVDDGEDIVFVVVLAGHRDEAFRTVRDGIDRLKDEVPLFKKEVTTGETFWVHERDV